MFLMIASVLVSLMGRQPASSMDVYVWRLQVSVLCNFRVASDLFGISCNIYYTPSSSHMSKESGSDLGR